MFVIQFQGVQEARHHNVSCWNLLHQQCAHTRPSSETRKGHKNRGLSCTLVGPNKRTPLPRCPSSRGEQTMRNNNLKGGLISMGADVKLAFSPEGQPGQKFHKRKVGEAVDFWRTIHAFQEDLKHSWEGGGTQLIPSAHISNRRAHQRAGLSTSHTSCTSFSLSAEGMIFMSQQKSCASEKVHKHWVPNSKVLVWRMAEHTPNNTQNTHSSS